MGTPLHEGWAILTFKDGRPPSAGRVRYERVGELFQWVLVVPACHSHKQIEAILDPRYVKTITCCTEEEAIAMANTPAAMRKPPSGVDPHAAF
jgi:hypothetical protein